MTAEIYYPSGNLEKAMPDITKYGDDEVFDIERYDFDVKNWMEKARRMIKKDFGDNKNSRYKKYNGLIISEHIMLTGYALYMIMSMEPLRLLHLPLCEEFEYADADKWTIEDVINKVEDCKAELEMAERVRGN
jgi:hypothetical protein